jgi:hypothetical protein
VERRSGDVVGLEPGDVDWLRRLKLPDRLAGRLNNTDNVIIDRLLAALAPLQGEETAPTLDTAGWNEVARAHSASDAARLLDKIGERIADEVERVAAHRQSNCEQAARDILTLVAKPHPDVARLVEACKPFAEAAKQFRPDDADTMRPAVVQAVHFRRLAERLAPFSSTEGPSETIQIGNRTYRKFIPFPGPVNDGTARCFSCGQIDEPDWHDDALCPACRPAPTEEP